MRGEGKEIGGEEKRGGKERGWDIERMEYVEWGRCKNRVGKKRVGKEKKKEERITEKKRGEKKREEEKWRGGKER